jgi:hypothetical protein
MGFLGAWPVYVCHVRLHFKLLSILFDELPMGVSVLAAWSVIAGLSLMLVGGLVLWAYGARQRAVVVAPEGGPEAEATQHFHTRLSRWFFMYGVMVTLVGITLLFWAGSIFF